MNIVIYDCGRITLRIQDLLFGIRRNPHVVIIDNIRRYESLRIYPSKAIVCPNKYEKLIKKELEKNGLEELCLMGEEYVEIVQNLSFLSDGRELFNPDSLENLLNNSVFLHPIHGERIATEFLPFIPYRGVLTSPLSPASFRVEIKNNPVHELAAMYLGVKNYRCNSILSITAETALSHLEELSGKKRGKSHEELMKIARERAKKIIAEKNIKLFLKFGDKVIPNPIIPENLFPEIKMLPSKIGKIPESASKQIRLLENACSTSPTIARSG